MAAMDNESLVRRIFTEVISQGKLEVADELIGSTYVNHNFPGVPPGPEGFKQVIGMFRAGFPDMVVVVEDAIGNGDTIATRGRLTGTNTGEFMGMSPTGRSVNFGYIDIWRSEDGKLVENWVQMDRLGMMQQLGVVPAPEAEVG